VCKYSDKNIKSNWLAMLERIPGNPQNFQTALSIRTSSKKMPRVPDKKVEEAGIYSSKTFSCAFTNTSITKSIL
jgi:hypothetical protein